MIMHPRTGALARLWAIVRQRCPRCFRGPVFRGVLVMNDPCPACGQVFQREEGYFLGAMYVSYVLGCVVLGGGYFAGVALFPDVHPWAICLALFAAYIPLMPLIYRYSRVIWLHLDYLVSPTSTSATLYEKLREEEVSRAATSPGSRGGRTPPG
jgi:uncharacterized protein (DUF983 family)